MPYFVATNRNTMNNLKALIKTKSNYKNLNGQWLTVKDFLGSIVACIGPDDQTIDFTLSEIQQIRQAMNVKTNNNQ